MLKVSIKMQLRSRCQCHYVKNEHNFEAVRSFQDLGCLTNDQLDKDRIYRSRFQDLSRMAGSENIAHYTVREIVRSGLVLQNIMYTLSL